MINKKTVLVLGAGASKPYGLPTGEELKDFIISQTFTSSDHSVYYSKLGISDKKLRSFVHSLRMSSTSSIDEFLEDRDEFTKVGKLAITRALIRCENENVLVDTRDWYQHLFRKMVAYGSFEKFDQNKISIVTFNYDRSLEHFLFTSLQNKYGKSKKKCADKLNKLPIVHVHGQIGNLPWQGSRYTRPYNTHLDTYSLNKSSLGIGVIHESDKTDPKFKKAHELLTKAERIYFLGFGYHPVNLTRLKIRSLPLPDAKFVLGTSLNKTDRERKSIQISVDNKISLLRFSPRSIPIYDFLREHVSLE